MYSAMCLGNLVYPSALERASSHLTMCYAYQSFLICPWLIGTIAPLRPKVLTSFSSRTGTVLLLLAIFFVLLLLICCRSAGEASEVLPKA